MGGTPFCNNEYSSILEMLDECNIIRYTAYRTAAKIRVLQKALKVEKLTLSVISNVFSKHHLRATENEAILELSDLQSLVSDIFLAIKDENTSVSETDVCVLLLVQVLLRAYKSVGSDTMQVFVVKLALVILCSSQLQEKYQYLFHQLSDHNNCVSKKKIDMFIKGTVKLTDFLSEPSYSAQKLVETSVENCFSHCQGNLGLTEDAFMDWLFCEPPVLIWHSVVYRLQSSELVCHYIRCDVCKSYPITGMRYTCLHCFNYNQCQQCFFTGKVSKNHKLKHPIQEFCCQIKPKEAAAAFLKMVKNKIHKTSSKYLHYDSAESITSDSQALGVSNSVTKFGHTFTKNEHSIYVLDDINFSQKSLSSPLFMQQLNAQQEMQSIIKNLEEQERKMAEDKEKIIHGERDFRKYMQKHQTWLNSQIFRLKLLMEYITYLQSSAAQRPLGYIESTPIVPQRRFCGMFMSSQPSIAELSPIVKQDRSFTSELQNINFHFSDLSDNLSHITSTDPSLKYLHSLLPNNQTYYKKRNVQGENSDKDDLLTSSELSCWLNSPRVLSLRCPSPGNETHEATVKNEVDTDTSEIAGNECPKSILSQKSIDDILERLQSVVSSNFQFEDSYTCRDNTQLQKAATEIEELLACLIDRVEQQKRGSEAKFV